MVQEDPKVTIHRITMTINREYALLTLALLLVNSNSFSATYQRSSSAKRTTSSLYSITTTTTTTTTTTATATTVALTREEGKNGKLEKKLLETLGNSDETVKLQELPCIAHAGGDDLPRLEETLRNGDWDYVAVTSPEAARVLSKAWNIDGCMEANIVDRMPAVAVVGKATQAALEKFGIPVDFCPSKATAKTLVAELPPIKDEGTTLLYPASAKAATVLQDGLTDRGFVVTRLNTYDTTTATWTDDQKQLATTVLVACFGSPSAVKGWLANTEDNKDVLAACIGETSATACRELNFSESNIFYPEKPGVSGWAQAVKDALKSLPVTQHN